MLNKIIIQEFSGKTKFSKELKFLKKLQNHLFIYLEKQV